MAVRLCDPANMNILIRSKSFEGQTDEILRWYNTKYEKRPFSEDLLKLMRMPNVPIRHKKLDLPPPNLFLPKNFDILPPDELLSKKPSLI